MKKLLAIAMLSAAFAAHAQGQGFYVGGHLGQAQAKSTCDDFRGPGISCDDSDMSWKILGGYRVNRHFAAELGYIDFGEFKATGPGGTASAKASAFDLVAVGILPIADRFSVYGKLGAYHGTVDAKVRTFTLNGDASDDSTNLTYGVGAGFDMARNLTLRAEWQQYKDVGGSETVKADIDVISLGVLFRF